MRAHNRFLAPLLAVCALALALVACPGPTMGPSGGSSLWIASGQTELDLRLIDYEPPPF